MPHPLVEAARKRDFNAVSSLLDGDMKGVDRQILQECFVRCVLTRDLKLVKRFLTRGADIDGAWNGYTALSIVSGFGDAAFVRGLLKCGAGVNVVGYDQATPLIAAARVGKEWKDPEIRRHSLVVAKTLLAAGADVDARDLYHKTALDYAFESHWEQLARLLFSTGASIGACDDGAKLMLFWAVSQPGSTKLLQMYLKHGGSPDLAIGHKDSVLATARQAGWNDKVNLLEKALKKPQQLKPSKRRAVLRSRRGKKPGRRSR
jgi:ankyrin repeat protein